MGKQASHLVLYGNVGLIREFCQDCRGFAFVFDDKLSCCGHRAQERANVWKRETEAEWARRLPSRYDRDRILLHQDNRCLYCEYSFGATIRYRGRLVVLRTEWDHVIPFSYSRNNAVANFVAACQICNQLKSNYVFDTLEDAQAKIWSRRRPA